jgi:hypothetical protein
MVFIDLYKIELMIKREMNILKKLKINIRKRWKKQKEE